MSAHRAFASDPRRSLDPARTVDPGLVMRGFLIVIIVLGHNRIIMVDWPEFFGSIYKWHVQGFFFLALASRTLRREFPPAIDVAVRFLAPFAIFFTLATLANSIRGPIDPSAYGLALLFGSARLINAACDMALFWFLPAFTGFLILLAAIAKAARGGGGLARVVVPVACVTCLAFSYYFPRDVAPYIPLGLPIAIYLIPGAILFTQAVGAIDQVRDARVLAAVACLLGGLSAVLMLRLLPVHIDVSLFKYGQQASLSTFAMAFALALSMNLLLYIVARPLRATWFGSFLRSLGARSLMIFLLHNFVQAPLVQMAERVFPDLAPELRIAAALMIAVVAIAVAWMIDSALKARATLRALVLPLSWRDWTGALRRTWRDPRSLLQTA